MNNELIQFCENSTGFNKQTIVAVLDSFKNYLARELRQPGEVKLEKFGVFSSKISPARMGRNPRTGASVHVPEKIRQSFKFSKTFVDSIQGTSTFLGSVESPVSVVSPALAESSTKAFMDSVTNSVTFNGVTTGGLPVNSSKMWFAALPGQTIEIPESALLNNGVTPETLLWSQGMSGWEKAANIPAIAYLFGGNLIPPPLPAIA
ncbi:HU family DNA-binding protein [Kamptonema animale CS-326]|jgi:nucleoid DNA-binding protein|uniref:HU family DNA-binding protein n=1 Tax=Kamptonema animale TaxID=92934 RepID=UPI00232E0522|nr:HU family DNA-binding protein [Kamptonema animale]MDB9513888.1 HU family DNA-binding protein [Kamptonema animale CS-326]